MHHYFDIADSATKRSENCVHILSVIRHPVGGIRTFIRYVYTNFNKTNYRFTLLAPDLPELHVLLNDLKCFETDFIPIKKNPSNFHLFLSVSKAIFGGKFDLIHSHGFTSGLCTILPSILTKTPHIMTSHDVFNKDQLKGIHGCFKKIVFSLILPMSNVIHHVSYNARKNMLEYLPVLKKFPKRNIVIPNGINIQQYLCADTRDFRKELRVSEDTFLIGFMGRFMAQKGFRCIVEAIELLSKRGDLIKQPKVLSFGWGGFIREEQKELKEKGIQDYFMFLPFVSNVAESLKGLDVLVMPSLWEACPILPMEAMVTGVPVIGTSCIGLREVLKNTPAKIIPPKDSKAFANAIIEEMSNPSVLEAQQFAGEAAVRFDVKNQANKLEHIILNLTK